MRGAVLALLCFVAAVCADVSVSFQANANVSTNILNNNGWSFRNTSIFGVTGTGFSYTSYDVSSKKGTASAEIIYGGVSVSPQSISSYISTFSGDASSNIGPNNAQTAKGYVTYTLQKLTEFNSQGVAQRDVFITWGILAASISTDSTGSIQYVTYTGTTPYSSQVSITFIASDVAGKTDYANAVVSPKSLESVISISGHSFQNGDATNYLAATILVGTGSGKVTSGTGAVNGVSFLGTKSGSQVFFSASSDCYIGGSTTPSKTQVTTTAITTNPGALIDSQKIVAAYALDASYTTFNVAFPAGAGSSGAALVWDPTVGSGRPYTQSAAALVASFTVLIVAVLATLL